MNDGTKNGGHGGADAREDEDTGGSCAGCRASGVTAPLPTVWEETYVPSPRAWSPVTYVGLLPTEERMKMMAELLLIVAALLGTDVRGHRHPPDPLETLMCCRNAGSLQFGKKIERDRLAGMDARGFCIPPDGGSMSLHIDRSIGTNVRRFCTPPDGWRIDSTTGEDTTGPGARWTGSVSTDTLVFCGPLDPFLGEGAAFGTATARSLMVYLAGTEERVFRVPPDGLTN